MGGPVTFTGFAALAALIVCVALAFAVSRRRRAGGGASSIEPADLAARIARGERLHILDVRSEAEFAAGHVPGAVNVPFNHVGARLGQVPGGANDELYVYCGHGPRAYMAASSLRQGGRSQLIYVRGHFAAWQRAGHPVAK
jgi:rhodanese-related sulfurtransferase